MLKIKKINVSYQEKKDVLKNIQLNLEKSEILGIVGESGSGKSTLLKTIIGALSKKGTVNSGEIYLDEEIIFKNQKYSKSIKSGKDISMIFQDSRNTLNPIKKIGTQFVEYIQEHSKENKIEAREKAKDILKKMKLSDVENLMNRYPHEMSGGMCQRVGIAMAMVFNPKVILADEPTSALDVTTQAQIIHELLELRERYGTSIIIVTHNLGVASYISDRIIVMRNGEIVEEGKPKNILKNPKSDYTKLLIESVPKWKEN